MAYFKAKNLCDKSLKITNMRRRFSCIFRSLRSGILRFFCRRRFLWEIPRSKSAVSKIFKKVEKWAFLYAKIRPFEKKYFHFFRQSSRPVRAGRFAPPNFDRGLKTRISSDDRRAIKKWSFSSQKWPTSPLYDLVQPRERSERGWIIWNFLKSDMKLLELLSKIIQRLEDHLKNKTSTINQLSQNCLKRIEKTRIFLINKDKLTSAVYYIFFVVNT